MSESEAIGRRIAAARRGRGLTQRELAQMLSRPRSHVALGDIERGKTRLNVEEISEFAGVLGLTRDDLLGVDHSCPRPMWEYLTFREATQEELDSIGRQGWELVHVVVSYTVTKDRDGDTNIVGHVSTYIFKRLAEAK